MFKNISGTAAVALLTAGDNVSKIKEIRFTNTHTGFVTNIDLYVESNSLGKFYIAKGLVVNAGNTIVLENGFDFDNTTAGYSLYIELSANVTMDVIILKS